MRAMRFGVMAIAIFSGGVWATTAGAQVEAVCTPGVFSYMSYSPGFSFPRSGTVTPYTVKFKLTYEQRLPEGNIVRGFAHAVIARDSSGRMREERPNQCYRGEDDKPTQEKQVTVFDPKEQTNLWWQEAPRYGYGQEKRATLNHMQQPSPQPAPKKLTPEEMAAMRKAQEAQQPPKSEFKHEDLGVRNIAGVEAHGTRTTRTIPAGEEGNELQLVVVDEMWRSDELGLVVMGIRDDPRQGRHVQEAEEIDKTEPVAALFAPPEGYKIVEMKPQVEVPVNPKTAAQ